MKLYIIICIRKIAGLYNVQAIFLANKIKRKLLHENVQEISPSFAFFRERISFLVCVKTKMPTLILQGLISEAQVDSFNLPLYFASPKEITQLVGRNGCFVIEKMEITCSRSRVDGPISAPALTMHLRAGLEGIISKHFGLEIIDELFDRFYKKKNEVFLILLE